MSRRSPLSPPLGPTAEDLTNLLNRLRSRIARLFARQRLPELEAERVVSEALIGLAYRWHRVPDREQWLLETLARGANGCEKGSSKEPKDE